MKRLTCLIVAVLALMLAGSAPAAAQRITDSGYRTVAHIKSDGTIQDAGYRTIGHIKKDGTVQDAGYHTIGHVKRDGTIQDAGYHTIGHAPDIPLAWAAFYFFFRE